MSESLRHFIDWMAAYTLSPPGEVMAMALRVVGPGMLRPLVHYRRADPLPPVRLLRNDNVCWMCWPGKSHVCQPICCASRRHGRCFTRHGRCRPVTRRDGRAAAPF